MGKKKIRGEKEMACGDRGEDEPLTQNCGSIGENASWRKPEEREIFCSRPS